MPRGPVGFLQLPPEACSIHDPPDCRMIAVFDLNPVRRSVEGGHHDPRLAVLFRAVAVEIVELVGRSRASNWRVGLAGDDGRIFPRKRRCRRAAQQVMYMRGADRTGTGVVTRHVVPHRVILAVREAVADE
jgi:hypothetical protein